ncbi:MAG: orotate phosphoribosyltransferase [Nitriliruptor sp.]|uniref:orotate phosphoribosyltransferase n=1 Tax=Nitriliruptor sp. TaxID=2448056 RepID=UPI00349FEC3E
MTTTVADPAFVDLLVQADVLTFGDFVTKSGRPTPYFANFGNVRTGAHIAALGRLYADRIVEVFGDDGVDVVFGPAYKGIPLAVAATSALASDHGWDIGFAFDRKEAKDHGEGGTLVGHQLRDGDRVVIIEDVTTAGTSVRETVPKLRAVADVSVVGLVIGLDRQERGPSGDTSALDSLAAEFGLVGTSLATIEQVVDQLVDRDIDGRVVLTSAHADRIAQHLIEHGPR